MATCEVETTAGTARESEGGGEGEGAGEGEGEEEGGAGALEGAAEVGVADHIDMDDEEEGDNDEEDSRSEDDDEENDDDDPISYIVDLAGAGALLSEDDSDDFAGGTQEESGDDDDDVPIAVAFAITEEAKGGEKEEGPEAEGLLLPNRVKVAARSAATSSKACAALGTAATATGRSKYFPASLPTKGSTVDNHAHTHEKGDLRRGGVKRPRVSPLSPSLSSSSSSDDDDHEDEVGDDSQSLGNAGLFGPDGKTPR